MANLAFNASTVDPTPRFEPLPAGDYNVIITESETKMTRDGAGQYLQLKLEIQGGEYAGRTLFDRLNLWNNNKTAQEIAQRTLSQICHAIGHLQVNDSQELHYKPLVATVKIRPSNGQYDAQNEVKGYKQAAGAPVQQGFQAPQAAKPAAPGGFGSGGMPWMQKAA